jgi:hypothetical protein
MKYQKSPHMVYNDYNIYFGNEKFHNLEFVEICLITPKDFSCKTKNPLVHYIKLLIIKRMV